MGPLALIVTSHSGVVKYLNDFPKARAFRRSQLSIGGGQKER